MALTTVDSGDGTHKQISGITPAAAAFDASGKVSSLTPTNTDAATAQCTLYESDGVTEVSGVTWPLIMTQDSGTYIVGLPATLAITAGKLYYLRVKATWGNAVFDKSVLVQAQKRYQ